MLDNVTRCVNDPKILDRFELEDPRDGARAGSRTLNLGIKSPLLCQLSYASAEAETAVDSKGGR